MILFTLLVCAAPAVGTVSRQAPSLDEVVARATAYVAEYEQRFSLLVAEETYTQEQRRPDSGSGGNLSQRNPGGGFATGGLVSRVDLISDYLLVRLPDGGGWMPFRDVFEVSGRQVRDRRDRLVRLFLEPGAGSFDQASRIMQESTRYNIGSVARTINIPTLALLFVHPDVVERFAFSPAGSEVVAGREARILEYRERARPTLIKTTRGRDLPLSGRLWIEPASGVILRTSLTAADPVVRANVEVLFREDALLGLWVPERMDEFYKAARDANEIFATATYANFRRFRVDTGSALRKPPGR